MTSASLDNPFPGLRPFEFEDRKFFFGRRAHLLELHRKLVAHRFVAVVGTSGSGKSSLVKAGLLGRLHDEWERRSGPRWLVVLLRPQGDPIHALARRIALAKAPDNGAQTATEEQIALETARAESRLQHSSLGLAELLQELNVEAGGRVLVVVDQFEELFRYPYVTPEGDGTAGVDQRALFVKHLLEASEAPGRPFHVLITMRSEFLGDCTQFHGLPETINDSQFLTPRLTREQRREAIVSPIELAGGSIAPALIQRLLNDVGNEPDQLPVMQHALMRTWALAAPSRKLELSHYEMAGRMERSISDHANQLYDGLDVSLHSLVGRIFKSLTDIDREGRETRRPCRFGRLVAETGGTADDVLAAILPFRAPDCAFVVPTGRHELAHETVVDISHEALIRKWDRLASTEGRQGWVAEEGLDGRIYGRLLQVAETRAANPAILLSPPETRERGAWWDQRLPNAHWADRHGGKFELVAQLIASSRQNVLRERRHRRLRRVGAAVAAAVALVVLGYGYERSRSAEGERRLRIQAERSMAVAEKAWQDAEVAHDGSKRKEAAANTELDKLKALLERAEQDIRAARVNLDLSSFRGGWLGAEIQDVTLAEAERLGWESSRGGKVGVIAQRSPAADVGLTTGDIILSIDQTEIETASGLNVAVAARRPGDQVRLRVLSGGRERLIAVTLGEQPKSEANVAKPATDAALLLMLDPGGHMSVIRGLTFTPDGKQIVSTGDDKVIRVWDWRAAKTVRTIRGQVGPGPEGKIFAMALSPDGRWLAVGGYLGAFAGTGPRGDDAGPQIRLHDFATGKLTALLKGHTNIVNGLAFSADSKRLISGSFDQSAIIWDIEKGTLLHRLHGHKAAVDGVALTPDGARAVTASDDTTIRLWSVKDGKEVAALLGHKDRVRSVAVSPVDGAIASGGWDGEIRLWDSKLGRLLRTFANQGTLAGPVRFSPDGKLLLSTSASMRSDFVQRVWEVAAGRQVVAYARHDAAVLAAAISPDGRLAATGGGNNHAIDVWDLRTGETRSVLVGAGAAGWATAFSEDGRRIAWGNTWRSDTTMASNPLEFQLVLAAGGQRLGQPERIAADTAPTFLRARTKHGAYTLAHRQGGSYGHNAILDIKKDGSTLVSIERGLGDGYEHRAYAFTPDGQTIISGGGGGFLTAYDLTGKKLGDFVGHDGDIWAVTPSPDGRLLISGSADQTIRLWNLMTRELIITLFRGTDAEWVIWTPQGCYTGSPGADKIVGWQINKGPDKAADYVGVEQLRQHMNRPDIVEQAVILASAELAVRQAPGTSIKLADLLARSVPRFRVVSPSSESSERAGRTAVKIAIEATPDPVQLIRVQVNGRQVAEQSAAIGSGGFGAGEQLLVVPLGKGRNDVRVTLSNAIGERAETLIIAQDGEGDLDQRGELHILAIGVDQYPGLGNICGATGNASCDLKNAGADARLFTEAVERRLGPAHARVTKRLLVNGGAAKDAPTAANIIDAMEVLRSARETDTVVLFIAGHGINEGPDYRFLPTNAEYSGGMLRGSTVVPWQVLQGALEAARGRRLLFVDTAHSGNSYNSRIGNAAYHANIMAYSPASLASTSSRSTAMWR